jgi:hypothetical protein
MKFACVKLTNEVLMLKTIFPLILMLLGCSNPHPAGPEGEPWFPQLAPATGERSFPSAEIDGTLVLNQGCIRLQEGNYLVIWPPRVRLESSGGSIQVIDEENQTTARVGEKVRLAGGEVQTGAPILDELRQPLPSECPGPYWLASGIESVSR